MNEFLLQKMGSLIGRKDIESCFVILDKYINCYVEIFVKHEVDPKSSELERYDKVFFQMILSKAMNLKKLLSGVSYRNEGIHIGPFIDPIVLIAIVRNLFETLCTFESLNIVPKKQEQKELIFSLFLISGYKNRQKFDFEDLNHDFKQQLAKESQIIEDRSKRIKESELYQSLSPQSQNRIDGAIRKYEYKFSFDEDNEIRQLNWEDVLPYVGINGSLLRKIYSQLSMYAHPSYISLMQFGQMFKNENPQYVISSIVCMRYCFFFLNIFLMDYMKLFPEMKTTYEKISEEDKIMFGLHNQLLRTLQSNEEINS